MISTLRIGAGNRHRNRASVFLKQDYRYVRLQRTAILHQKISCVMQAYLQSGTWRQLEVHVLRLAIPD